jgi:hypothetical protein
MMDAHFRRGGGMASRPFPLRLFGEADLQHAMATRSRGSSTDGVHEIADALGRMLGANWRKLAREAGKHESNLSTWRSQGTNIGPDGVHLVLHELGVLGNRLRVDCVHYWTIGSDLSDLRSVLAHFVPAERRGEVALYATDPDRPCALAALKIPSQLAGEDAWALLTIRPDLAGATAWAQLRDCVGRVEQSAVNLRQLLLDKMANVKPLLDLRLPRNPAQIGDLSLFLKAVGAQRAQLLADRAFALPFQSRHDSPALRRLIRLLMRALDRGDDADTLLNMASMVYFASRKGAEPQSEVSSQLAATLALLRAGIAPEVLEHLAQTLRGDYRFGSTPEQQRRVLEELSTQLRAGVAPAELVARLRPPRRMQSAVPATAMAPDAATADKVQPIDAAALQALLGELAAQVRAGVEPSELLTRLRRSDSVPHQAAHTDSSAQWADVLDAIGQRLGAGQGQQTVAAAQRKPAPSDPDDPRST